MWCHQSALPAAARPQVHHLPIYKTLHCHTPFADSAQVLALCAAPFLLDNPRVEEIFPVDVIARAKKILSGFKGGVGAYTDSRGNPLVREEVARFIEKRDGVPSNPDVSGCVVRGWCVFVREWGSCEIKKSGDSLRVRLRNKPRIAHCVPLAETCCTHSCRTSWKIFS